MAIVDTEYSEYAPRRPYVTPVVVQNRYLCFARSPTTGDVPLVSVFDTTTHTSRAFTMPGVTYKTGDQVAHKGTTYRCITGHTSMIGWEPDQVPALWARV